MEFIKSKVFEVLQSCYFLNNADEVRVMESTIEIYKESDLVVTYDINVNRGKIIITFTDSDYYTSEELENYLSLLVDLKECVKK